ncbi:MAG: helix-hairpin-helix domain-containing protein [Bacteroidales bacterium]|nr:helix-hairpin-helix domain-containing protein [Bacteroidales bacterium]
MKIINRIILTSALISGYQGYVLGQAPEKTDSIGQEEIKTQDWTSLIEEITENSENEMNAEDWQDRFSELSENPIPLNTATKEMLESIPFLSEEQIESLSYYLYRYGPLVSLSELMLVEGMDEQTLRWMKPFVRLGKPVSFPVEMPTWKNALKYGKQEIRARFGRSLQEKAGYAHASDSTLKNDSYSGDPFHIYLRYGFNYKGKIQWGLVLEKDAGEKLWNKKNKGIDYASFHFSLKDQKRIKTLIIGDYNLQFGQGLVCASSFSMGKSASGTAIEKIGTNISRHFSASESRFFRGIGATFILKPFVWQTAETKGRFGLEMTSFASIRNIDAKITEGSFSTISTSELHRTIKESAIKDQLKLYTIGTHFSLKTNHGQFGLTGLTYGFNADFNPEPKPYNCHYFRGKQGGNGSLNYRLRYKGMLFFGEFGMDANGNTAFLSGTTLHPDSKLDISILTRNYTPKYQAYYGNSFSEGTSVQNEYGFFATCEWKIFKNWRLNAYYDLFVFPWLKYGIDKPSNGSDHAIQATWKPSFNSEFVIRFKSKTKDKNLSGESNTLLPVEKQTKDQIRIQISSKYGSWVLKTVIDGNLMKTIEKETRGFSASQEVNYSPNEKPFSFSVKYALFDTDHYDNRIYSYEKDLPGTFSMTPFYGQGNRFSLLLKYKLTNAVCIQIKIGHSVYHDRQQVGTGLEQVQGNQLTDIRSLFLWKF